MYPKIDVTPASCLGYPEGSFKKYYKVSYSESLEANEGEEFGVSLDNIINNLSRGVNQNEIIQNEKHLHLLIYNIGWF